MTQPQITGATRLVGLIGSPVRYSGSPTVHNAVFQELGLDYAYVAFDVDKINLLDAVRGMKALGFLGFNVAAPCKTLILPYLDEVSEVAELAGAVNIVVVQDGRLLGDNGDGAAFMRTLVMQGVDIRGKKITVLGAGGAASAIATQCALDGVAEIEVFNRLDEFYAPFSQLIPRLAQHSDCKVVLHDLADRSALRAALSESALVVNATNVGMPDVPGCLLDESMMAPGLIVCDLVYSPRDTELLKRARAHGNKTIDGVGVFVQQAAMGERLWLGREMPVPYVMKRFFS